MNKQQIQEIIFRVLSECGAQETVQELPLDFPVEVSAKHVHLTEEAIEQLFGTGAKLTPKRPLSQPGQFLSEERVTLVTTKGRIENVAVLGPARSVIQTELSVTDCRGLGIDAPLRMSGDLRDAGDVYIIGPKGMIYAKGSVIVAQAHIHITPSEAESIGIKNGQKACVTIQGERSITLENVICRVSSEAALAMHIDFDEANACMLPKKATARMKIMGMCTDSQCRAVSCRPETPESEGIPLKRTCSLENTLAETLPQVAIPQEAVLGEKIFDGKLMTEAMARQLIADKRKTLTVMKGAILTPSAKDVLHYAGVEVLWKARG